MLYLHGPALNGYGFWQGQDYVDICTSSTGARSKFWASNPEECNALVLRKVNGFVVMVYSILVAYVFTVFLNAVCTWFIYINPVVSELRALRRNQNVVKLQRKVKKT